MKISIIWQRSGSDKDVSHQLVRQMRLALGRFASSIQTVAIYISDASGRKDRVKVRCVVAMKLMSTGDIVVLERGEDVFSALNYCLSRAGRTISRLLECRRNTPKSSRFPNAKYTRRV